MFQVALYFITSKEVMFDPTMKRDLFLQRQRLDIILFPCLDQCPFGGDAELVGELRPTVHDLLRQVLWPKARLVVVSQNQKIMRGAIWV